MINKNLMKETKRERWESWKIDVYENIKKIEALFEEEFWNAREQNGTSKLLERSKIWADFNETIESIDFLIKLY